MFAPTAYCGGFLLNSLTPSFSGYRFASPGDGDRYVGLVRDYGRLIRQMLERPDRKSDVQGKRVSERVDPRGRRNIKQKKKTTTDYTTYSHYTYGVVTSKP